MPAPALRPRRHKPMLVQSGSAVVKLYRTKWRDKQRRRVYHSVTLAWRDASGRHLEKRNTLAKAQARAKEIAESIINGRIALDQVSPADWATLQRARELLRPLGEGLELAISKYTEFVQILRAGCASLPPPADVAQFWVQHHPRGHAAMTCPQILTEMLLARAREVSQNTLDDYTSRLGRFVQDFTGPILDITAADLSRWLETLRAVPHAKGASREASAWPLVTRRTRNNYRNNVQDLFRFAKNRGYLPRLWPILEDVPRVKNEPVRIEVFTPEEILQIFAARVRYEEDRKLRSKKAPRTLIPYLAVGAFAGCRHEEMNSPGHPVLDWRHIDFEKEEIWVPKDVARKIGQDRILPMQPNLVAWLKPYARRNGPICELAGAGNALADAALAAGVVWKRNGLRRSFISYRLAATDNIGLVAKEAGTSPARINHNYKKTLPKREARRWFDIFPTQAEILQLPLAL